MSKNAASLTRAALQEALQEAYRENRPRVKEGAVASYIPELQKQDPDKSAACIVLPEGETLCAGDTEQRFTVQSISKIILLARALEDIGAEGVFQRVGVDPARETFNSINGLNPVASRPANPMLNAGAIATTSCILGGSDEARAARVLALGKKLLGSEETEYCNNTFLSEYKTCARNRALAYIMFANGVFTEDVESVLKTYCRACALLSTARGIAHLGAVLALDGLLPGTGERALSKAHCEIIRALMLTCGLYDASGAYAVKVGIPSKSGVGGGIAATVPGLMGIGVYSPRLDKHGNSVFGQSCLEYLSKKLDLRVI